MDAPLHSRIREVQYRIAPQRIPTTQNIQDTTFSWQDHGNIKHGKMCNFFTKFISASKVLVVAELFFAHFERGMWMTLVTSFKQILDVFLHLISKIHDMRPPVTLKL
jgi:hypothetical protein